MLQDNLEPKGVTLEQRPLNITMVRIHGNLRVREASTEAVAETNEIARHLRGQERLLSVSLHCGTAPSLKTGIKRYPVRPHRPARTSYMEDMTWSAAT